MCELQNYANSDDKFTLCNIYAPGKDKPSFIIDMMKLTQEFCENRIFIGDFNVVFEPEMDRLNSKFNKPKTKEMLLQIMDDLLLCDVWRIHNPDKKQYSWMKLEKKRTLASRIDYALVSQNIIQNIENVTYIPGIKTDHSAVFVALDLIGYDRGKGYWKMNTKYLRDEEYVKEMNVLLDQKIETSKKLDKSKRWEYIKNQVTEKSKSFAPNRASDLKIVIAQLSEKIDEMEENLINLDEKGKNILELSKRYLNEMIDERIKGIIFRTKTNFIEYGEMNSKFYFAMEKTRAGAKTCSKLIKENGDTLINPKEILEYQKEYYQKLYKKDDDVELSLENETEIRISEDMKRMQEEKFSIQEMAVAIKGLNNSKTPGCDGIPIDWYKMFFVKIKDVLYDAITNAFEIEKLHDSAMKGIINLIPKATRDSRFLGNLRPIMLLATDLKIIEKMIANRFLPALNEIIDCYQKGFMRGRSISANIRRIFDIMKVAEEETIDAMILSLDFQKCFDRISFSAITGSMKYFGFSDYLIK